MMYHTKQKSTVSLRVISEECIMKYKTVTRYAATSKDTMEEKFFHIS